MNMFNSILLVRQLSPAQLAAVILLSILIAVLVAGNVLLFLYLRNRGVRKLCTHKLQNKRDELLQQLNLLREGVLVTSDEEEEEEEPEEAEELLLVDEEYFKYVDACKRKTRIRRLRIRLKTLLRTILFGIRGEAQIIFGRGERALRCVDERNRYVRRSKSQTELQTAAYLQRP